MKQVIVMRTDLNMRKGKMVAQGAHASVGIMLKYSGSKYIKPWVEGGMTKICVGISSEDDLKELALQAWKAELPCYPVTDAGRTEFDGVPTLTCIAIGPGPDDEIDKITGKLKLL